MHELFRELARQGSSMQYDQAPQWEFTVYIILLRWVTPFSSASIQDFSYAPFGIVVHLFLSANRCRGSPDAQFRNFASIFHVCSRVDYTVLVCVWLSALCIYYINSTTIFPLWFLQIIGHVKPQIQANISRVKSGIKHSNVEPLNPNGWIYHGLRNKKTFKQGEQLWNLLRILQECTLSTITLPPVGICMTTWDITQ